MRARHRSRRRERALRRLHLLRPRYHLDHGAGAVGRLARGGGSGARPCLCRRSLLAERGGVRAAGGGGRLGRGRRRRQLGGGGELAARGVLLWHQRHQRVLQLSLHACHWGVATTEQPAHLGQAGVHVGDAGGDADGVVGEHGVEVVVEVEDAADGRVLRLCLVLLRRREERRGLRARLPCEGWHSRLPAFLRTFQGSPCSCRLRPAARGGGLPAPHGLRLLPRGVRPERQARRGRRRLALRRLGTLGRCAGVPACRRSLHAGPARHPRRGRRVHRGGLVQ
mmetsp:Transcript_2288/g.8091  ORF Transcript_2288/g.8091 Transcript_2288/m.8091 type:complete len:281 (+) Transcript_2288:430-1272(+)